MQNKSTAGPRCCFSIQLTSLQLDCVPRKILVTMLQLMPAICSMCQGWKWWKHARCVRWSSPVTNLPPAARLSVKEKLYENKVQAIADMSVFIFTEISKNTWVTLVCSICNKLLMNSVGAISRLCSKSSFVLLLLSSAEQCLKSTNQWTFNTVCILPHLMHHKHCAQQWSFYINKDACKKLTFISIYNMN